LFQDARLTRVLFPVAMASTSANNEPSLAATMNQCIKHVGSEENLSTECVVAVASTSEFIKHVNSSLTNRLETKADEDSSFGMCDFIAPIVVEFLGVLSLVRFGATSKSHRVVVLNEVMRRRKVVALIEEDVSNLIGNHEGRWYCHSPASHHTMPRHVHHSMQYMASAIVPAFTADRVSRTSPVRCICSTNNSIDTY